MGDQRFESFARIIFERDSVILSSQKSTHKAVDTEGYGDEEMNLNQHLTQATETFGKSVLVAVSVTTAFIGFIIQFLGLRVMHSSVTIA